MHMNALKANTSEENGKNECGDFTSVITKNNFILLYECTSALYFKQHLSTRSFFFHFGQVSTMQRARLKRHIDIPQINSGWQNCVVQQPNAAAA